MTSSTPRDPNPPTLVLGSGITALGAVRTLARQGIPLLVAKDAPELVHLSRWYRAAPDLPALMTSDALAVYLERLDVERAVLLPCTDEIAAATAALPGALSARFPSYLSAPGTLQTLLDKGAFLEAIERLGVPHPRTRIIGDPEELRGIADEELRHAFVKPRDSQAFFRRYGVKALRPGPEDDVRELMLEPLRAGFRLMLQEYVPGPASHHYFIDGFADGSGHIVAHLARQRLRMFPLDFGNSTSMVTVPPSETADAVSSLQTLLAALAFRGIFSAEFKKDQRDGTFRIIEVNARPWWYIEFAARAGLDVVRMTYEAALGRPVPVPGPYKVGERLVHPYYEFHALQAESRSPEDAWRRLIAALPGAQQPVLALDDPWPAIRATVPRALRFASRPFRTALRRSSSR